MREVESHVQSFVSADEVNLLNNSVRQTSAAIGQLGIRTQTNVFGTKDKFHRLAFAEPACFFLSGQPRGADFDRALSDHAEQQVRRT